MEKVEAKTGVIERGGTGGESDYGNNCFLLLLEQWSFDPDK